MRVRSVVLAVWLTLLAGLAFAQAPPARPIAQVTLSGEQFDALVESITNAVTARLASAPAPPPAPAAPGGDMMESQAKMLADRVGVVLGAMPAFLHEMARIPGMIDSSGGERRLLPFLLLMSGCIIAALAAQAGVPRLFAPLRRRLASRAAAAPGMPALPALLALLGIDALGLAAIWLVSYGATGIWFSDDEGQSHLAAAILIGLFAWRLYMFAFGIVLRPDLPGARLAAIDDGEARRLARNISIMLASLAGIRVILRIMVGIGSPEDAFSAGKLVANVIVASLFVWLLRSARRPVAAWLEDLAAAGSMRALARNWLIVGFPFIAVLTVAQMYGSITARPTVPNAVVLTLNVVIGLVILATLSKYLTRPRGAEAADRQPRLRDLVARCLRMATLIAAAVTVAQSWVVDVLGLVDHTGWAALTRSSVSAGLILFAAFVAWELVDFFARRAAPPPAAEAQGPNDEATGGSSSRSATLVPLLRIVAGVVIVVLATFMVLSELGVNVTPLIAGASVLGLAVSFGSQTLVRDIVSGIFYLLDDAFRTGEYIDVGKAKGTVEGFTLRSLRLRHQSGMIHTIPFGQLGQITNFSRDWTTVKFNLRFVRGTDLEKLRKTTKALGQRLREDEELRDEFIEPLKMMGVIDILDHAIVVRFKFTVKPGNPSFVQRTAIKYMVEAYAAAGIEFANTTVAVQTVGDPAASAAALQQRVQAEAAAGLPAA